MNNFANKSLLVFLIGCVYAIPNFSNKSNRFEKTNRQYSKKINPAEVEAGDYYEQFLDDLEENMNEILVKIDELRNNVGNLDNTKSQQRSKKSEKITNKKNDDGAENPNRYLNNAIKELGTEWKDLLIEIKNNKFYKYDNRHMALLFYAVEKEKIDSLKYLIAKGADANARDMSGKTLLHTASLIGSLPVIEYLISSDAEINEVDINGHTPLHYACWYGHFDVVNFLVSKSADINAKNSAGKTPLDLAKTVKIQTFLKNNGARKGK